MDFFDPHRQPWRYAGLCRLTRPAKKKKNWTRQSATRPDQAIYTWVIRHRSHHCDVQSRRHSCPTGWSSPRTTIPRRLAAYYMRRAASSQLTDTGHPTTIHLRARSYSWVHLSLPNESWLDYVDHTWPVIISHFPWFCRVAWLMATAVYSRVYHQCIPWNI